MASLVRLAVLALGAETNVHLYVIGSPSGSRLRLPSRVTTSPTDTSWFGPAFAIGLRSGGGGGELSCGGPASRGPRPASAGRAPASGGCALGGDIVSSGGRPPSSRGSLSAGDGVRLLQPSAKAI